MLILDDISVRIAGRLLIDHASVTLPAGSKTGFVGRNGTGKSTLFRVITGDLAPETGSISLPKNTRIGQVAQEAPGTEDALIEIVMKADKERTALLEEADTATDPHRIAVLPTSTLTLRKLAQVPFCLASASMPKHNASPRPPFPAAGVCASLWPLSFSPSRTCYCSTNRPTISTLKACCGWSTM
jgi:energy-coupling factor transporter ATP-binding protein EcfA2